jgi:hypothetical protein
MCGASASVGREVGIRLVPAAREASAVNTAFFFLVLVSLWSRNCSADTQAPWESYRLDQTESQQEHAFWSQQYTIFFKRAK